MPSPTRNDVLEEMLRERVITDSEKLAPRRRPWATVAVGVLAFILGGTLVGGVVSAATAAERAGTVGTTSTTATDRKPITIQDMSDLLQGGFVIGDLHFFQGPGGVKIDLGTRPADANAIVVLVTCDGSGTFDARFGGESHPHEDCAPADSWGLNSEKPPTNSSVSISQDTPFAYYVTAQWAYIPPAPQPSAAQQAEIADGVITPHERADALARYITCEKAAGFAVTVHDDNQGLWFTYTPAEGPAGVVAMRCGEAELSRVETLWEAQTQ